MENESAITKRGRVLEDEFFHRVDQKLMAELRAKMQADADKQQLQASCGFRDPTILDELVGLGFRSESIVALSLVPLVQVAWADGKVDEAEREAVLRAAETNDCPAGSASFQLLEHWLAERPSQTLVETWRDYVNDLRGRMSSESFTSLGDDVRNRAEQIAAAAGGILGIGKISAKEQAVLADIRTTFQTGEHD